MEKFFEYLLTLSLEVDELYSSVVPISPLTQEETKACNEATKCGICKKRFKYK